MTTKKNQTLHVFSKIFLMIFAYVILYYFLMGITAKPSEGDSLAYHIPIAKSILNGIFLHPHYRIDNDYFPGASEIILAGFIFLHIPLNLYNVTASVCLFLVVRLLAIRFRLTADFAIVCAVSICLLTVVLRWITAQTIDIWLAVFYIFSFVLLLSPKNSLRYFIVLGCTVGMTIGSKYSGPGFILILIIFYGRDIVKYFTVSRIVALLTPLSFLGLFWYIRNYYMLGNPLYPLNTFFLKGKKDNPDLAMWQWQALLMYPKNVATAFFGEYLSWAFLVFITPVVFIYYRFLKHNMYTEITKLMMLGFVNFCFFLLLISGPHYQQQVSDFRYSYPAFIPLILSIFLLAQRWKQEITVSIISLANIVVLPSLSYHPKILFFFVPIAVSIFYSEMFTSYLKKWNKRLLRLFRHR